MISISYLLRHALWTNTCSLLENVPNCVWEEYVICYVREIVCICLLGVFDLWCCSSLLLYYLIFSMDVLFMFNFYWNEVLKYPIMLLSISPFISVNVCFHIFLFLILGLYIFIIVTYSCWIHPFIIIRPLSSVFDWKPLVWYKYGYTGSLG